MLILVLHFKPHIIAFWGDYMVLDLAKQTLFNLSSYNRVPRVSGHTPGVWLSLGMCSFTEKYPVLVWPSAEFKKIIILEKFRFTENLQN